MKYVYIFIYLLKIFNYIFILKKFCAVSHIFVFEIVLYEHIYMVMNIIFNGAKLHNKLFLIKYILYASEEKVP